MADLRIDKFKANFDNGARPNRFTVNMFWSGGLEQDIQTQGGIQLEGLRCEVANLPGRQLLTNDFSEYGPVRKLPYGLDHDGQEVQITFYCDSSFADRLILEAWQSQVFVGNSAGFSAEGLEGSSDKPVFNYYNEYVGRVELTQFDLNGDTALRYTLQEAYPLALEAQELNMGTRDEIMRFTCRIAFRTWSSEYVAAEKSGTMINSGGFNLANIINFLSSVSPYSRKASSLLTKFQNAQETFNRFKQTRDRVFGLFG